MNQLLRIAYRMYFNYSVWLNTDPFRPGLLDISVVSSCQISIVLDLLTISTIQLTCYSMATRAILWDNTWEYQSQMPCVIYDCPLGWCPEGRNDTGHLPSCILTCSPASSPVFLFFSSFLSPLIIVPQS